MNYTFQKGSMGRSCVMLPSFAQTKISLDSDNVYQRRLKQRDQLSDKLLSVQAELLKAETQAATLEKELKQYSTLIDMKEDRLTNEQRELIDKVKSKNREANKK